MNELLQAFLLEVKRCGHLYPLMQQADVRLTLQCGDEKTQLEIKQAVISILNEEETSIQICGELSALKQLLEGKERLRVLEKRGAIKVTANLRTALWLESLFFLANQHTVVSA